MQYSSIILSLLTAFVAAQDSVPIPSNPNTQFLTQTDSNGVITGQATVATSQPTIPAVITTQPLPASIPAIGSGLTTVTQGNATYTVSANNSTTIVIVSTSTSSRAGASGAGGSAGASGSGSKTSTGGAAATGKAAAGAFIGAAGLFAALL